MIDGPAPKWKAVSAFLERRVGSGRSSEMGRRSGQKGKAVNVMNKQHETPAVLRPELRSTTVGPPRVAPRQDVPVDVYELLRKIEGGEPIRGVMLTLAHNPRVAKRFAVLVGGLLAKGTLPARARELVILRMGWRCGARYEFSEHTKLALDAGLTLQEIARLTQSAEQAAFDGDDAVLVALVDDLYDANTLSESTWERLRERWQVPEIIELLVLAGTYWTVSGVLNTVRVALEDGASGWPPGVAPPGLTPQRLATG